MHVPSLKNIPLIEILCQLPVSVPLAEPFEEVLLVHARMDADSSEILPVQQYNIFIH
jgi:hypothetical protein